MPDDLALQVQKPELLERYRPLGLRLADAETSVSLKR